MVSSHKIMTAGGTCCNQLKVAPLSRLLQPLPFERLSIIKRFERYQSIESCFVLSRHGADTASAWIEIIIQAYKVVLQADSPRCFKHLLYIITINDCFVSFALRVHPYNIYILCSPMRLGFDWFIQSTTPELTNERTSKRTKRSSVWCMRSYYVTLTIVQFVPCNVVISLAWIHSVDRRSSVQSGRSISSPEFSLIRNYYFINIIERKFSPF